MARRVADVWKARKTKDGFLAAYTAAVACVRNNDRGRSIKGAYYRYAVHPTTIGTAATHRGASVLLGAAANERLAKTCQRNIFRQAAPKVQPKK